MNNDTDVLEFDFPDYEEPYPPFPDVKVAPFDKEDSYSRNRDIADKFYAEEKQIKEKKKNVRKARHREIKIRKTVALTACLALCAALTASALNYIDSITEQPEAVLSEADKEELLAFEIKNDPFFAAAKVIPLLERIDEPDRTIWFHEDDYAVTINFTVKNISDEEIGFVPHRFYIKLKNGKVVSPNIADGESFSYNGLESPWNGMRIPAGEQVSFRAKYYVREESASQIKCFAYNVYNNYSDGIYLYADIADEDSYVSQQIAFEIEKLKNGGKKVLP